MKAGTRTASAALAATLAVAAGLAACGDDDKQGSGPASPKAALAEVEAALPGIQQAVPAELKDKLRFEARVEDKDRIAAAVPAGWESKFMPGSYDPPDEAKLGFATKFGVGTNCDGTCAAKDWKASVDKVEFGQFQGDGFTIAKDEPLGEHGRIVVAQSKDGFSPSTYVVAAWWKEGASRYAYCRAIVDKEIAGAVAAFEKACRATRVLAW